MVIINAPTLSARTSMLFLLLQRDCVLICVLLSKQAVLQYPAGPTKTELGVDVPRKEKGKYRLNNSYYSSVGFPLSAS